MVLWFAMLEDRGDRVVAEDTQGADNSLPLQMDKAKSESPVSLRASFPICPHHSASRGWFAPCHLG